MRFLDRPPKIDMFQKWSQGRSLEKVRCPSITKLGHYKLCTCQTQLEQNFREAPTIFSVIQKFPEIRQKDNKSAI
jgi:hypothetical protein